MKKIQAIRGMNDLLPQDSAIWQYVEATVTDVLQSYGYREIRFPLLEQTELFKRSIGEVTDIVEKEMYTFADRNGDSLTLRPEGTASCVRACEQHGLLYNQVQRLWYSGPMFRHERPQKGRLRQFHQVGVETFGMQGPDIDVELLLLTARLWQALGIDQEVTLQINSLGVPESRAHYRAALVEYLTDCVDKLDADSQRRLHTNPLRILDSKDPQTQALLSDAPKLNEFLDDESRIHFESLRGLLNGLGIAHSVNPHLVRGLDYYTKTVFEWVTDALGAQGTVCAGGRYDGLVEQLGGKATPAVGFAMGIERLVLLVETVQAMPEDIAQHLDIYLVADAAATEVALNFAETLRNEMPYLRLMTHCGGGSFKNQLKKADKSGAAMALILGEDEIAQNKVTIKFLREAREQSTLSYPQAIELLQSV